MTRTLGEHCGEVLSMPLTPPLSKQMLGVETLLLSSSHIVGIEHEN